MTTCRGRPLRRWILIGLLGFLGVRALAGGAQFVLVPSGDVVGVSTAVLEPTPFDHFLVPGLFLFGCLGVLPLVVAFGLYRGDARAWTAALAVAGLLATWAIVEGSLLGFGERLQYLNLLQAIAMAVLAFTPAVRWHRDAQVTVGREG